MDYETKGPLWTCSEEFHFRWNIIIVLKNHKKCDKLLDTFPELQLKLFMVIPYCEIVIDEFIFKLEVSGILV